MIVIYNCNDIGLNYKTSVCSVPYDRKVHCKLLCHKVVHATELGEHFAVGQ